MASFKTAMAIHFSGLCWLYDDILVCNVRCCLGNDVHEGVPAHTKGLKLQFIILGAKDNPLPPANASEVGPDPMLDSLKAVLERTGIHGIQITSSVSR